MQLEEFKFIYNTVIICFFIIGLFFISNTNKNTTFYNKSQLIIIYIGLLILGLLFGLRTTDVGSDTEMYAWQYKNNFLWADEIDEREPLYPYFIKFLRIFSLDPQFFLVVVAFMYVGFLGLFIKKFEEKIIHTHSKYFLFLGIVAIPCFLSLGINIVRQGISIVFLMNAYNAYRANSTKKKYIFSFLAIVFHSTSLLPLAIFWISTKIKQEKTIIGLYFIGFVIAFLNFGLLDFFRIFSFLYSYDPRFDSYTGGEGVDYIVGFKSQFVVFNTCFLLIGIYVNNIVRTKEYLTLLSYFVIASFVFFMAFQLPYSDRWGIFSWISMPLLVVPLFNQSNRLRPLLYIFFFVIFLFFNFYKSD